MGAGFAAGEEQWRARLGKLRDVVRQELVARQLDPHLPRPPRRILDVGCGQGTQALRLLRRGHLVTGLDSSPALLAQLQQALAAEAPEVRRRAGLVQGPAERLADLFRPASFDLAAALARHGLPLRAWYGVRVFTDTAADDAAAPRGEELDALLACEERAGRTDPYRRVAALTHAIAERAWPSESAQGYPGESHGH